MFGIQIPVEEMIRFAELIEGQSVVDAAGKVIGHVKSARVKSTGIYPEFGVFIDVDTIDPPGILVARIL